MPDPAPEYTPINRQKSALTVAESVFSLMQRGPEPLSLHTRDLRAETTADDPTAPIEFRSAQVDPWGGANRPVSLWTLREQVLRRQLPVAMLNRMWVLLVSAAQALHTSHRESWTVGAVGMALPALCALASDLAGPRRHDPDLDAEVLGGFLTGLAQLRPSTRVVFPVLMRHARVAGLAAITARRAAEWASPVAHHTLDRLLTCDDQTPRPDARAPEQVLTELVDAGVITSRDAGLIAATRLGGISEREAAAAARLSPNTLVQRRLRAERRIAAYLGCSTPTRPSPRLGGHQISGSSVTAVTACGATP
jgi:hypothetical protein